MENEERDDFSVDAQMSTEPSAAPADPTHADVPPPFPPPLDAPSVGRSGFFGKPFGCAVLIVFFLCATLFSVSNGAREAARRMKCCDNLKQIVLAMHNYHDVYNSFPPAYTEDSDGRPLHSWRTLLLPFLNKADLYEKIRLDEPWDSEWNSAFHSENLPYFYCPSSANRAKAPGACFYSVVVGEGTCFPGEKAIQLDEMTDGTSNTVLLVERKDPIRWMRPDAEITLDEALKGINAEETSGVGSSHPGGCNVAAADASTRFISEQIDPNVWKALLLIADGEKIGFDGLTPVQ